MIHEAVDDACSIKENTYTINTTKSTYLLKEIRIKKQPLLYSFLGGMWYSTSSFSLEQDISLPYPFSTYYTFKIIDKTLEETLFRSTLYIKTPLLIMQFKETCISIQFDPYIIHNDTELFPFIGLKETDSEYIISFVLFNSYEIKTKDSAWLGRGKKETITVSFSKDDTFQFATTIQHHKSWQEAVEAYITTTTKRAPAIKNAEEVFNQAKNALWRSYDALTGSFLQLPWKHQPGFSLQNSSYSLLSYEAVRLDYFSTWNQTIHDSDLTEWEHKLRHHFTNTHLSRKPSTDDDGLIWYNMTNLTKKGLQGYFYMDCGYAGYPGGQASISYHLLHYLETNPDEDLKKRVHQTIKYILSTQQKDGSWPMAIHHEGIIRFRPEKLHQYTTHGGTGEAVRALLLASKLYQNKQYKKAAEQGLRFLSSKYPICYHGLRDIGINEPEAFSAVSIIHAFLDGYDLTSKDEYLTQAFHYAWYLLTWMYTYDTINWKISHTIHPISYSITPRVSPYETIWVVHIFLRLSQYTKQTIWKKLARHCYTAVLPFISHTGGLSEGVFPLYNSTLEALPMEQTFATTELMNASYHFMKKTKQKQRKRHHKKVDKNIEILQEENEIHIHFKQERICTFDAKRFQITHLKDVSLGTQGITISLNGPYTQYQKIKHKITMNLRGNIGKYLLSGKDAAYAITGVKPPKQKENATIQPFAQHITNYTIEVLEKNKVQVVATSDYHQVIATITASIEKNKCSISFDPLTVTLLTHDLRCSKIIIPYIDALVTKKEDHTFQLKNWTIKGEFAEIKTMQNITMVDQTLRSNWTQGGKFSTAMEFILE